MAQLENEIAETLSLLFPDNNSTCRTFQLTRPHTFNRLTGIDAVEFSFTETSRNRSAASPFRLEVSFSTHGQFSRYRLEFNLNLNRRVVGFDVRPPSYSEERSDENENHPETDATASSIPSEALLLKNLLELTQSPSESIEVSSRSKLERLGR